MLGVLYKIQNRFWTTEDKTHASFVQNDEREEKVTEMLGYFWHLIMAADTTLRPGMREAETEAEARQLLETKKVEFAEKIGIDSTQVVKFRYLPCLLSF